MRITILGMGNMGRAFAARAIETGHQTTVWNRTPGRVAALVASGAIEANTATAAASGADAVLVVSPTMLPSSTCAWATMVYWHRSNPMPCLPTSARFPQRPLDALPSWDLRVGFLTLP